VVVGAIVGLIAFGMLAIGGVLLCADSKKDEQGYIHTAHRALRHAHGCHRHRQPRRRQRTAPAGSRATTATATSASRSPAQRQAVFVGIARTKDVSTLPARHRRTPR
jgi:hypothetical protein